MVSLPPAFPLGHKTAHSARTLLERLRLPKHHANKLCFAETGEVHTNNGFMGIWTIKRQEYLQWKTHPSPFLKKRIILRHFYLTVMIGSSSDTLCSLSYHFFLKLFCILCWHFVFKHSSTSPIHQWKYKALELQVGGGLIREWCLSLRK